MSGWKEWRVERGETVVVKARDDNGAQTGLGRLQIDILSGVPGFEPSVAPTTVTRWWLVSEMTID